MKTDSSTIETKYYQSLNSIRVFNNLNKQNKSYYTDYYYDSKKVRETGAFLNNGSYGVWREFFPNGKLKREINYAIGKITFFNKTAYPFYDYQLNIKSKADALIKHVYGDEFFKKHIIWDIGGSFIYNGTLSGNWTDSLELKPKEFLMRYAIKFDGKTYFEMIELHIDKDGKFVKGEDVKGLEKLSTKTSKSFALTLQKAITTAKLMGLKETSKNKANAFLTWENESSNTIYSGHFRIYVTIKTGSISSIRPRGRSTVVDKYDVYVFNPWSGTFINKTKKESITGWEEDSGSSTGLLPAN
ncbi:hypothetical protein [Mucilaginibacter calamicampi]|uniref:hypothetical protein n=1 Tax=Mucilaginibacter calamicampi TaxID=1302352 RepID=UPI00366B7705